MKFNIPLIPCGQMRARSTARKIRGRITAMTYKDPKQRLREETLQAFLLPHVPSEPISGAVMLKVTCFMLIPKSWSRIKRDKARSGVIRPTTTPDLDNLLKHIKDCMTQMRFWQDDKQVVGYLPGTGKYYSDHPRWEIEIEEA